MKDSFREQIGFVLRDVGLLLFAAVLIASLSFVSVYAVPENTEEDDTEVTEEVTEEEEYTPSEYRLANDKINEWEDRVLIAAMGQLNSEGRVYYAYGDYLDELVSYFVKGDLDLSESEANDAIKQITDPKNAKSGAQSGYLYQIGGKPKDSNSLIEDGEYDGVLYPEFDETVRFANASEYRASDLYRNNKTFIDNQTGSVYESKSAMRKEMKEIAAADRTYSKILSKRPAKADITEVTLPKNTGIVFLLLSIALLIITIVFITKSVREGAIAAFRGLDDESWNLNSSGRKRHRIRKVSAIVLAAVVALDLTAVFAGLTFNSTFGSDGFIEAAMDSGGICQHGYMGFRDDVHTTLYKNKLPQNSLDMALTYRDYRFDYIKGTRSAMKNGSVDVTYRGIQDAVQGQVDLMAYIANKDSSKVVNEVNRLFEESMSTDIGIIVYKLRNSMKPFFFAGFMVCIVNLLLASFMLVIERNDVYRGIRNLGEGVLAGTIIWTGICAYMKFAYDASGIGLASDEAYVMYVQAMKAVPQTMIILLCIGAIAAALLFVTSAFMRRRTY